MKNKLFKWFKKNHDLVLIFPISLLLFLFATWKANENGLRVYDYGILQKLLIAIAFGSFIVGIVRLWLIFLFPGLMKIIDEDKQTENGEETWHWLTHFQKSLLAVILFVGFLLVFAVIFAGI